MISAANIFQASLAFIAPLLVLVIPGITLTPADPAIGTFGRAARAVLWSISVLTLGTFLAALFGIPVWVAGAAAGAVALAGIYLRRREALTLPALWRVLVVIVPTLLVLALFSVPFLLIHDGLPTGDSQKTIIWSQRILDTGQLPDYQQAPQLLNRDPVDFYTPGLHALTALVMWAAGDSHTAVGLVAVGFFAIVLSIAAVIIGVAIVRELTRLVDGTQPARSFATALLAALFILTHFRFLRYLREPGYHFQNVAGELLLFGLLLLVLSLLCRWRWSDATLAVLVAVTLALTHQFSAFLAPWLLAPAAVIFIVTHWHTARLHVRRHTIHAIGLLILFGGLVAAGFALGLHNKIPHIFTASPHLLSLTPALTDYPRLMGSVWLLAGLTGLVLMARDALATWRGSPHRAAFVAGTLVLLAASQGPRLGLDIPPVRTLLFAVIPLSITAAHLFSRLFVLTASIKRPARRRAVYGALVLTVATAIIPSSATAFNLSHTIRTNSTLTAGQLELVTYLGNRQGGAILVDDYNRRSASWLVLSGKPMFARIAADLERQMNEAGQSAARYELYIRQLAYEKIFALGSLPEIVKLLRDHSISYITGIERSSSAAFARNPGLREAARADDIILYTDTAHTSLQPNATTNWLLRASTLANDIGDDEDTFKHLQASVRATRLGPPQFNNGGTYRVTSAPLIPLVFNVGDYVRILWDAEHTGYPDTAVELVVRGQAETPSMTVITPTGATYHVQLDGTPTRIQAKDLPFDDDGFLTLLLRNPAARSVSLDLIALGPGRVP